MPRARLQSELLDLRADLVHIAAEEARGPRESSGRGRVVLEVTEPGLRPGLSVSTGVLARGSHGRGCSCEMQANLADDLIISCTACRVMRLSSPATHRVIAHLWSLRDEME